ncbi:MAG: D-alanyl-D-alanine carboxypeptidase/D-alanyl-D-alanine-endopeptidase [Chitinophagaceae bacterium]|nr:MAG: D-alanyl-D-alanine carboxypeptidase/D-alanyl-D-alanine-endopeptidase [Chitinophagaceae bacterium]
MQFKINPFDPHKIIRLMRLLILLLFFLPQVICSQDAARRISKAFTTFRQDPQLANASYSLYVIDAASGEVVFDYNSKVALAPASTQKVITTVTAFETLGAAFRFRTDFGYTGFIKDGVLNGDLVIRGSGDPSLGSWRYPGNSETAVTNAVTGAMKKAGIRQMEGIVYADDHGYESATVPGGWIWDDLGNYYGAGASALNWRENQYDLYFKPGAKVGDQPEIVRTVPPLYQVNLVNELTTAAKGSGDNSYIYLPPYSATGFIRGTIPMENNFKISGSFPDPALQAAAVFTEALKSGGYSPGIPDSYHNWSGDKSKSDAAFTLLHSQFSPALDSLVYWFNKKSINLYGESLLKKMGSVKNGTGSTAEGINVIKEFWKGKGIEPGELDLGDGSGLSPQNRVTTHAQVTVLRYAINRPWYKSFVDALPEYNNMKMKSGTIRKVKGFCGYQQSAGGKSYVFSFLVNNYSGNASSLIPKMYSVLDQLK